MEFDVFYLMFFGKEYRNSHKLKNEKQKAVKNKDMIVLVKDTKLSEKNKDLQKS